MITILFLDMKLRKHSYLKLDAFLIFLPCRDIGFLLYLPANLESGATVQAYIETNTTEPFTAELNFIHSNEDRHFYSSARIENGEGSIDIEVCPTVVG